MLIRSYSFEYTGGSCTKISTLIAKCKLQTWSEKERRENWGFTARLVSERGGVKPCVEKTLMLCLPIVTVVTLLYFDGPSQYAYLRRKLYVEPAFSPVMRTYRSWVLIGEVNCLDNAIHLLLFMGLYPTSKVTTSFTSLITACERSVKRADPFTFVGRDSILGGANEEKKKSR